MTGTTRVGFLARFDLGHAGDPRLPADVEDVGALVDELGGQLEAVLERAIAPGIGEGVGAGVDDAHHERAVDRRAARSPMRRVGPGTEADVNDAG